MKLNDPSVGECDAAKTQGRGDFPQSNLGRQVYYQRDGWAVSLSGLDPDWRVVPLAESCPAEDCALAVVVVDQLELLGESWRAATRDHRANLLYVVGADGEVAPDPRAPPIFAVVQIAAPAPVLRSQIRAAFDNLLLMRRQSEIEKQVQRSQSEIDRLNEIGIALSSQHDRESLLNLILQKSREISQSDAGSLYLVEDDDNGGHRLRFTLTQKDSSEPSFAESHLPIDNASVAGYVALTGVELAIDDVYRIAATLPFRFNSRYDEESGKVGVREQVLVKAKKLYPGQLELIQQRFAYARKALEHAQSERKLAYLLDKGRDEFLRQQAGFQGELAAELLELDELLGFIVRCNEPTLLHEGNFARLALVAARQGADADG